MALCHFWDHPFFFISAGRAFHQSHPTLPFTTVSWAVMLCASSQALYGLLQSSNLPSRHNLYRYVGVLTIRQDYLPHLPFPLPFSLILTCSGQAMAAYCRWTSVVLITGTIMVSESRAGMLSARTVFLAFFPIKRTGTRKALFWGIVTGFVAAIVFPLPLQERFCRRAAPDMAVHLGTHQGEPPDRTRQWRLRGQLHAPTSRFLPPTPGKSVQPVGR